MSEQCYLYVIVPEGAERPAKIGITANPDARLKQLQTGNPQRLRIYETFWALTREEAAYWEELAHQLFREHRMAGEWFDCPASKIVGRVGAWKREREPRSAPQRRTARNLPALDPDYEPWHPFIPEHLRRPTAKMSDGERLEYWSCFDLPRPPEGFDDWYIVGSDKAGVLGAFPIVVGHDK